MENYQIDNLDRGILDALMGNARTAYAELAKQFGVSPGTIHVRVEKMKQAGIITGARIDVSLNNWATMWAALLASSSKAPKTIPPHWPGWKAWMR